MASLTIVVEGVEQKVPLEAASVTLGRGLESDVRLKDIKASRRHCQVVKTSKGYQCVDLSSGNGTYINGVQIKSQMLNPGDKITIGSTTVLFEDAAKPAVSSKAATAKIPVATAPAPSKPVSKVATAKVQVAPTKRTTERVEAVKPASQAGIKPATTPGSKSGSRVGKATGRASSVRQPRPAAEASTKKKSPVLLIAAGAAVLLLGAGAWFVFGARDNSDQIKHQIEQLKKSGDAARDQDRLDAAVQEYRKALDLCQGDRFKIQASEIAKRIAQVEGRKGAVAAPKSQPKESPDKEGEFQARKTEIGEKHKLADPTAADWAGALKDWTEFASRKSAGDSASRAQAEIRTLQAKAREDAARLKAKADALVKENKMAEAVDLLKHQAARFEGTDAKTDLDAAIKQVDK